MKTLALPLIVGAFAIYACAFSGVWTPPGFEKFPTYKVVLKHTPWGAEKEEEKPEPVSMIVAVSQNERFQPESVQGVSRSQVYLPHGVTGGISPEEVVELPQLSAEEMAERAVRAQTLASRPVPKRRKIKWTKYEPVEEPSPYKSYVLEGSRTRLRVDD